VFIRINLLPRDLRPRKTFITLDYRVIVTLVVIISAVFMIMYYINLIRDVHNVESQLKMWKQREVALQSTINLQNEVNALREKVKVRVEIIKSLTTDSNLRFSMLQYVNTILPANSWLLRINEQVLENKVYYTIEGMSYTKKEISAFLADLEKFDKFNSVALESIRPAPTEIRDAYQYSVKVELKTLQASSDSSVKGTQVVKPQEKAKTGQKTEKK
jgi:Tfp pilus assembly protein PilN